MLDFIKILIICICVFFISGVNVMADEATTTLTAGISLNEEVPADFFGTWRVVSNLVATEYPKTFKQSGIDLWNLSKTGDVINLCNPVNGASASVKVEYVKNNTIRFTKEGNYDKQLLTDTVEITLSGNKFTGKNYLSLKTYSPADNSLQNEKTAVYSLRGDKISGTSILGN